MFWSCSARTADIAAPAASSMAIVIWMPVRIYLIYLEPSQHDAVWGGLVEVERKHKEEEDGRRVQGRGMGKREEEEALAERSRHLMIEAIKLL